MLGVACRPLGNYGDRTRGATRPTHTCGVARFKALVSQGLANSAEPTQVDPRGHVVAATPHVWLTPGAGGLQPACPPPRDTPASLVLGVASGLRATLTQPSPLVWGGSPLAATPSSLPLRKRPPDASRPTALYETNRIGGHATQQTQAEVQGRTVARVFFFSLVSNS